jgi:molecular chaperone DnaK
MARIIGIDLGTTNSCVAVFERGAPMVIPTPEGERTVPSVVSFAKSGAISVGAPARRQLVTNAARTVFGSKRLIGRKVSGADVERFARSAPFRIVAAPNGDAWIRLDSEKDVSPQEVSSYVLERMKQIAETGLGEPITQAVVTVPAYFNDAQRQATKDAGRLAGLDVRRILNEPTAAALAYGVHKKAGRQRIAVFDLGGGTFDISILEVSNGVFEVLAVGGDSSLGGDDWDRRIVERLLEIMANRGAPDAARDPMTLGRLKEEAERAKKQLSDEPTTELRLPFVGKTSSGEPIHLEEKLSLAEFESLTADLVERLHHPCYQALADANIGASQLDQVLLVGGMTRVRAVQAQVEKIFAKKPSKGANPDEIVALGAAAHGAILGGEMDDVVLLDVTPQSLGIRVGGSMATVIPRNTTVPARARKIFATTKDNQEFVSVEVYQGEGKEAKDNRHLGRFTLEGLPPGPAGSVKVELNFMVDADGLLSVAARELSTGVNTALTIAPAGGLGEDELTRLLDARRARR